MKERLGWRDGSAVAVPAETGIRFPASTKWIGFIIPVTGDPMPPSGLCGNSWTWCPDIHGNKTPTHIKINIPLFKRRGQWDDSVGELCLPPSLTIWIRYQGPTLGKKRTSSYKLSSDLHMCAVADSPLTPPHPTPPTNQSTSPCHF